MKPQELVLALRAMGLTQKQIQKRTGIPQPTISKIGRYGERDVMLRTYDALLAAYEQQLKEGPVAPGPVRKSRARPARRATMAGPCPAPVVLRPFPRGPLPWPAMHRD